jgi:serine/threonine-protein kinase RsbT
MAIANGADVRVERTERLDLRGSEDVVRLRQAVRERAVAAGFTLIDQTKIVTAASELGRNTVQHGGGGEARISVLSSGLRRGLRLEFVDTGPGIADLALALTDGYTTGNGLGLGLSGARRLSDEFDIESAPGAGTRVTIVRWGHRA